MTVDITGTEQWAQLAKRVDNVRATSLRELFANEDGRTEKLTFDAGTLHVDLSKNLMCLDGFAELVELARAAGIEEAREKMFRGDKINTTENRSVLHTALRLPAEENLTVGDQDVAADVHEVLGRMRDFARSLRSGDWLG